MRLIPLILLAAWTPIVPGCAREVTLSKPYKARLSGSHEWVTLPAGTRIRVGGVLQSPSVPLASPLQEVQKSANQLSVGDASQLIN